MKEKLMEILQELRPEVDFESEKELIDGGVLDSFDIEINVEDLMPENFNSVEAMLELIEKLQEE